MAACNKKAPLLLRETIQVSNRGILTREFSVKLTFIGSHGARRECVPLTASYIPHDTTSGRIIRKYQ